MYVNYPFSLLISAIRSADIPEIQSLLSRRGLFVGPPGVIDIDVDYRVYEVAVESRNPDILDLFIANDPRVIPHLLNSAAKQGRVDVIRHISAVAPSRVQSFDVDRMVKYAAMNNHLKAVIYLVGIGGDINNVPGPAAGSADLELLD